jgi:hypothetical protein
MYAPIFMSTNLGRNYFRSNVFFATEPKKEAGKLIHHVDPRIKCLPWSSPTTNLQSLLAPPTLSCAIHTQLLFYIVWCFALVELNVRFFTHSNIILSFLLYVYVKVTDPTHTAGANPTTSKLTTTTPASYVLG